MTRPDRIHLAAALDAAGWHPAAWREADARPDALFTADYWVDLARTARRGRLDFITVEDSFALQSDEFGVADSRTDRVRGRLDAVAIAARVAPAVPGLGVVPTAVVTLTEPFHLSKAVATLDYVSRGNAGVRVQVAADPAAAANVGRRTPATARREDLASAGTAELIAELFGETADYVEVLRRLWDSWEDDAEIRDIASGRFIDRDKLHYIDFVGDRFSVRGPSITPRPPQGQPPVAVLAHTSAGFDLIASSADLGFVTPIDQTSARSTVAAVRDAAVAAGRDPDLLRLFGDLVVVLDDTVDAARARLTRLDDRAGRVFASDAEIFVGTPDGLADLLTERHRAGLTGFRLRPAALPHDLEQIVDGLVPELTRRGLFPTDDSTGTLRDRLGLPRPANRYAAATA
ncbi:LLM class flavin-dependent oxidoreductase [Gordonia humi]|uniref:Alkanesulfonate monooxygenase SsuD/methylene tetrahydromethanopterin reductase-like flavin-dependent oxidoreductase (Luciferase family) n=1 Tax=Gordonia humi TaxID=686429 RepID=A0A840F2G3_9ACTN|nr:LLM class flavin-dependent oxidoreductase [Gordonia humi]MBB4136668.1 alkanesulfonate monooxygenase SsuD/methylene tetrahydromethanopterin reductase-like flavin-dependent oxidoreductase (luciferase family) [Gordonia humi]